MNLQILSKIPIEQILNPQMYTGLSSTQHELGLPQNAEMHTHTSNHSRKSKSNIPFR